MYLLLAIPNLNKFAIFYALLPSQPFFNEENHTTNTLSQQFTSIAALCWDFFHSFLIDCFADNRAINDLCLQRYIKFYLCLYITINTDYNELKYCYVCVGSGMSPTVNSSLALDVFLYSLCLSWTQIKCCRSCVKLMSLCLLRSVFLFSFMFL